MPEGKGRNETYGRSQLEERNARMEPEQRRGQVLSGIPFHSGNSPASSVDSRLNLDVLVLEGGEGERGDTSQLTAVLGDTLKKLKAPSRLLSALENPPRKIRRTVGRTAAAEPSRAEVMVEPSSGASNPLVRCICEC